MPGSGLVVLFFFFGRAIPHPFESGILGEEPTPGKEIQKRRKG
jgi:hypothetical protein